MSPEIVPSPIPPLAVFLPMLGAGLVLPLSGLSEKARSVGVVAVTAATAAVVASAIPAVLQGTLYDAKVLRMPPGVWMHLRADPLAVLFASTAAVLWLLVGVYSLGYLVGKPRQNRYYTFLLLSLSWILGVAYAANLLTLLVFYELFSILAYPLIVHEQTPEAMAAGTKYVVYVLIGGSLVILGVVLTFSLSGSQTLIREGILGPVEDRTLLLSIFWCFVAGFGVKAALMPLHGWVPDAHPAAPAPISALLSGVMVAAGSFGIGRVVFNVFGVELLRDLGALRLLGPAAAITVILAAILAINQDNLKRRLAYSTISQMGYVVLGLSLMGPMAVKGALIHIANHALIKGTLFLCAGIIVQRAGLRKISEMAGLSSQLPLTMAAFTVATLAMIGTPPLSGFVSKWYLGLGMVEVHRPLYLIVLLGGALLAAGYLLPVLYAAYFGEPEGETRRETGSGPEAPLSMLGPALAGAAITVVLGLFAWVSGLPLSLAKLVAATFLD